MLPSCHRPRPVLVRVVALVAGAGLLAAGCSDDAATASDSSPVVTICEPSGTAQLDADLPKVDEIAVAIDALEAELGAGQQYFEANATARVVNLFVALNDATKAQAWAYVDGELSSQEAQAASGGTFTRADLDFVPSEVLAQVRDQIPDAILESFYVHGDGKGNTEYGVLTSAQCGGGLDVVVGPDGAVKSVDPVN
jgi:hypothetical protein